MNSPAAPTGSEPEVRPSGRSSIPAGPRRLQPAERLLLGATVLSAAFARNAITSGAWLGDALLAVAALFALLPMVARRAPFRLPAWSFSVLLLILWVAVSAQFFAAGYRVLGAPFSASDFAGSFGRLLFFASAAVIVWNGISRVPPAMIVRAVRVGAVIAAGSALVLLSANVLGVEAWIPSSLAGSSRGTIEQLLAGRLATRTQGLFSEPSRLGVFLGMSLAVLLIGERRGIRTGPAIYTLIVVAIGTTLSPTAFLMAAVVVLGFLVNRPRSENTSIRRPPRAARRVLAVLLLPTVVFIIVAAPDVRPAVAGRVISTAQGDDGSGAARTTVSFEVPGKVLSDAPFIGAGWGNLKNVTNHLGPSLENWHRLQTAPEGWNVLAYLLGAAGLPGLVIGAYALFGRLLRFGVVEGGLALLSLCVSTGALLDSTLWVFLVIYWCLATRYHEALPEGPSTRSA